MEFRRCLTTKVKILFSMQWSLRLQLIMPLLVVGVSCQSLKLSRSTCLPAMATATISCPSELQRGHGYCDLISCIQIGSSRIVESEGFLLPGTALSLSLSSIPLPSCPAARSQACASSPAKEHLLSFSCCEWETLISAKNS